MAYREGYFKPRTNLSINLNDIELLCIEVILNFWGNMHSANDKTSKNVIFAVDLNINILDYESNKAQHFLSSMFHYDMIPTINKSSRLTRNTTKDIDYIITNIVRSGIQHRSEIIKTNILCA